MHYCKKAMKKKLLIGTVAVVFLLLGTVGGFLYFSGPAIPAQVRVVNGTGAEEHGRFDGACSDSGALIPEAGTSKISLDPASISLLSWNIQKGSHEAFGTDLGRLERGIDLVLLQESMIDNTLKTRLQSSGRQWNMVVAFELEKIEFGLLSASAASPVSACADRVPEPLLVLPKTVLATNYTLEGMSEELLVVNVHMVNFTVTDEAVKKQLAKVAHLVQTHRGPVIVAGDFNTWSDHRKSKVDGKMAELGLQEIHFTPDNRSRFFKHAVDEIYYRGLEPLSSISHIVKTSDHNPLEAHFRVAEALSSSYAFRTPSQ